MTSPNHPADRLWSQYGVLFQRFDDLSLARWLVQTLGHLNGGLWPYSHPLVGAYKLAAQGANQRQIWLKRLVDIPNPFGGAECCRSPLLPLVTRDVAESGLICMHCNETVMPLDDLPRELRGHLREWATGYARIHRVAHLDGPEKSAVGDFDQALDDAADRATESLRRARDQIFPRLLDQFPSVIWEDHDECLEVRPEDLVTMEED
ncbi:MAG TPA: hypothetical protein DCY13_12365 [Verrucomicrobiales bacterium]|nr:hypothetical protein [Verrucomicrobiales bacterium]